MTQSLSKHLRQEEGTGIGVLCFVNGCVSLLRVPYHSSMRQVVSCSFLRELQFVQSCMTSNIHQVTKVVSEDQTGIDYRIPSFFQLHGTVLQLVLVHFHKIHPMSGEVSLCFSLKGHYYQLWLKEVHLEIIDFNSLRQKVTACFLLKKVLTGLQPNSVISSLPAAAFRLQQRSVTATQSTWLIKPKIFTVCPFTGKVYKPPFKRKCIEMK